MVQKGEGGENDGGRTYSHSAQERLQKLLIRGQEFQYLSVGREVDEDCERIFRYFLLWVNSCSKMRTVDKRHTV
jgi:hypothetical protein